MGNMSHCRFINTLEDLRDCYDHMEDTGLSRAEVDARAKLIELCSSISDDYGEDFN
jgi:hypothetical protein